MINIKNLDLDKIQIDEKSNKNVIYYIGNLTIRDLSFAKINIVNPLYLIMDKVNSYFEESNGNKYLTLIATGEIKYILKYIFFYNCGVKSENLLD